MRKLAVLTMGIVASAVGAVTMGTPLVANAQTNHTAIVSRWCDARWGCDDNQHRGWCRGHHNDYRWGRDCRGWG